MIRKTLFAVTTAAAAIAVLAPAGLALAHKPSFSVDCSGVTVSGVKYTEGGTVDITVGDVHDHFVFAGPTFAYHIASQDSSQPLNYYVNVDSNAGTDGDKVYQGVIQPCPTRTTIPTTTTPQTAPPTTQPAPSSTTTPTVPPPESSTSTSSSSPSVPVTDSSTTAPSSSSTPPAASLPQPPPLDSTPGPTVTSPSSSRICVDVDSSTGSGHVDGTDQPCNLCDTEDVQHNVIPAQPGTYVDNGNDSGGAHRFTCSPPAKLVDTPPTRPAAAPAASASSSGPSTGLPETGSNTVPGLMIGGGTILAGAIAILLTRRPRTV